MPPDSGAPSGQSYRDVRGVNGSGPRCGCGKPSGMHVFDGRLSLDKGEHYFLCDECTLRAVRGYIATVGQPAYGAEPDDE